jgi:hypothetical protein
MHQWIFLFKPANVKLIYLFHEKNTGIPKIVFLTTATNVIFDKLYP